MLNLLGCSKDNFKKLLQKMNYKIFDKVVYSECKNFDSFCRRMSKGFDTFCCRLILQTSFCYRFVLRNFSLERYLKTPKSI